VLRGRALRRFLFAHILLTVTIWAAGQKEPANRNIGGGGGGGGGETFNT